LKDAITRKLADATKAIKVIVADSDDDGKDHNKL
jgi:hypothetical protein